jgi:ubiquinone/menaquinone biosynthesis C-methylase UbiE
MQHSFTPEQQAAQLRKPHGAGAEAIATYMRDLNRALYEHVVKLLLPANQKQLLELGFGEGIVPEMLHRQHKTIDYTGIDFSEEMVNMATAKNIPGARFLLGEVSQMPFDDCSFDICCGINVVYFWEHPEREFAEIIRVLKPGGLMMLGYRPKTYMQAIPFTQFGFTLYETAELENLLVKHGFVKITTETEIEPDRIIAGKIQPMQQAVVLAYKPGQ